MSLKFRTTVGSRLTGMAVAAAVALPTAAQAAQAGDLCKIGPAAAGVGAWVTSDSTGYNVIYYLSQGDFFRVEYLVTGGADLYVGHGTNRASGYLWRGFINQPTCHQ